MLNMYYTEHVLTNRRASVVGKAIASQDLGQIKSKTCSINITIYSIQIQIQDAAEGDSGAPLYTLGKMDPKTQERTESKLVGLHSSGLSVFVFKSLRRQGIILPKWNIRVSCDEKK